MTTLGKSSIQIAYPAKRMKAWRVGKAVGNTRNDDPSLIEPTQDKEPGQQLALFG